MLHVAVDDSHVHDEEHEADDKPAVLTVRLATDDVQENVRVAANVGVKAHGRPV